MKRIYLSGPITGRPVDEFRLHFATADATIRGLAAANGLEVNTYNPALISLDNQNAPEWHDYMRACVRELSECDGIALLSGWGGSRESLVEIRLANDLHIPIVFFEPPINELDVVCMEGINPEIYRYWVKLVTRWARSTPDDDIATDRSLAEISNRYLDPHGFEYIEKL